MERTAYLIKPEAFTRREVIRSEINAKENLKVEEYTVAALTLDDLRYFSAFDNGFVSNRRLFDAFTYFMRQGFVEIGVIRGIDAVGCFLDYCSKEADPCLAPEGTLRNRYGVHEDHSYNDQRFFLNGVHKSNNIEEANFEITLFEELRTRRKSEVMKEIVLREYQDPPASINPSYKKNTMMIWNKHILSTVDFAFELSHLLNGDKDVVVTAAYCHDRARLYGCDDEHHIKGAEMTVADLKTLGCDPTFVDQVYNCILKHRGSKDPSPETLEEKIVASADAISNIQNISLLWYSSKFKHKLIDTKAKSKVIKKIETSYNKIMPEGKYLVDDKYQKTLDFFGRLGG